MTCYTTNLTRGYQMSLCSEKMGSASYESLEIMLCSHAARQNHTWHARSKCYVFDSSGEGKASGDRWGRWPHLSPRAMELFNFSIAFPICFQTHSSSAADMPVLKEGSIGPWSQACGNKMHQQKGGGGASPVGVFDKVKVIKDWSRINLYEKLRSVHPIETDFV